MKKVISPCICKVYTRRGNEDVTRAFCKIEFDGTRLSITGVIGPCRAATAVAVLVSALMQSAKVALAMNGRRKCSTSSAPSGMSGI